MTGCAFGPCDRSTANGGPGCYMCDVMPAKFPQQAGPRLRERADADDQGAASPAKPKRKRAAEEGGTLW